MSRNRSCALVLKDKMILMEKVFYDNHLFWTIPGGGIEDGETPEQTVLRELKEETGLDGEIVRLLSIQYMKDGHSEHTFLVKRKDENQEPILGYDPEEVGVSREEVALREVAWKSFDELTRIDQDFLMSEGYLEYR